MTVIELTPHIVRNLIRAAVNHAYIAYSEDLKIACDGTMIMLSMREMEPENGHINFEIQSGKFIFFPCHIHNIVNIVNMIEHFSK